MGMVVMVMVFLMPVIMRVRMLMAMFMAVAMPMTTLAHFQPCPDGNPKTEPDQGNTGSQVYHVAKMRGHRHPREPNH